MNEMPDQAILTYGMIRDNLERLNDGQEKIVQILERLAGIQEKIRANSREIERVGHETNVNEARITDLGKNMYERLEKLDDKYEVLCAELRQSVDSFGGRFSAHQGVAKWVVDAALVLMVAVIGGLVSGLFGGFFH